MERITLKQLNEIYKHWQVKKLSRTEIADKLGISENDAKIVRGVLQNEETLSAFFSQPTREENFKTEITRDAKGDIVASCPISKDIDELLERFNIDRDYWDVTKSAINEWGSETNYNRQAKAWLSKKGNIIDWDTFKRDFIDFVKKESPVVPRIEYQKDISQKMLEISIYDLHLGKLAWALESGNNYDSKIAEERFYKAIYRLLDFAKTENVTQILFPIGNDFYNSDKDYPYSQTTAGTPQESDLRWQKVYKNGRVLLTNAINILKEVAPVVVPVIPGNHDFQKSFYLGDALEVRFENDENVTIDNSPTPRKYHKWGLNLIGFTHGRTSDIPINRLLMLMPQEVPQLWADTKYREWHCGDIHHAKTITTKSEEDMQGVVVKFMRSLKAKDSWENQKGYLSLGGAEAILWDAEQGRTNIFYYNL